MNPFPRFTVTVRLGERSRELSARELTPATRAALLRLVLGAKTVIHSRPDSNTSEVLSGPNVNAKLNQAFPETFGTGGEFEEERSDARELVHTRATYLADLFADRRNLAWYVQVAATLRSEEIDDAVARARDVPASRLRTTRARYFTALVRDRVKARRNSSNPYAQPSTTS